MNDHSDKKRTLTITLLGSATAALGIMLLIALMFRDASLIELQKTGVIRIGYAVEAPYAFLSPEGEVTGESPEIAKEIVGRLGIRHVKWRQVEFGALLAELEAGRIDVIAAGMFITPERAQRVNFSEPTFHVRQGLLVPKGNPRQLHSYQQAVRTVDIKIAVLSGSVEEERLRRLGIPDHQLLVVPDAFTGLVAVESGLVDGLALSSPTVQWMALRNQLGRTEMAQPFDPPMQAKSGYSAFAFRREDRRLLAAWNAALKTYIGSPEHLALITGFGFTPGELPDTTTETEVPVK